MANEFKVKKGLVIEGASGGTVLDVQGSQGQLFSVTDSLTGDLFAVSDISGIPILTVNSSGATTLDGTLATTGDVTINKDYGRLILQDTGTGNALNQWISYRDSAGTERAYMGYGSTGDSTFYIVNYLSDLKFYAGGVLNTTLAGANTTFAGTITASNLSGTNTGDQTLPTASSLGAVTLTGSQTISGSKTFSSSGNTHNGHINYSSYDAPGNHYSHFRDGSGNSGTTVNWRQFYGSNYKTHTWASDSSGNMAFTFQGDIDANGGDLSADNFSGSSSGTNTGDQTLLNQLSGGYLPLIAGSSSPLTGNLHIETSGANMLNLKDTNSSGDSSNPYISFYDSTNTRQGYVGLGSASNAKLYLEGLDGVHAQGGTFSTSGSITVGGSLVVATTLNVEGNTVLGNANGDKVHINDILHVGATDSGNSDFFFGEGGTHNIAYGAHWHWDSGYGFNWYTRNSSTDTLLMHYDTNDLTHVDWHRNFVMNSNNISGGGTFTATTFSGALSGNAATATLAANSTLAGGLAIGTGVNNSANQIVRTQANGYTDFGWINTVSGTASGTPVRIYCSQDAYIRYYSPASLAPYILNQGSTKNSHVHSWADITSGTVPTFNQNTTGEATTARSFSTGRTNYKTITDGAVAGQLMWKEYGNNHTIFDASDSTSPSGTSVNNTNATNAWTGTYPTLMGWNGSGTYGVRVDSARYADTVTNGAYTNVANNFTTTQKITESEPKLRLTSSSSPSLQAGLMTQVGGQLLGFGTNYSQIGSRNASYAGGFFRIDARVGYEAQFFTVQRIPANGSEAVIFKVGSTGNVVVSGNLAVGATSAAAKLDVRGTLRSDQEQDSGPGGNTGAGTIGNLIGDAGPDDTALGTPNKWLKINLSGNDYLIPAYSE